MFLRLLLIYLITFAGVVLAEENSESTHANHSAEGNSSHAVTSPIPTEFQAMARQDLNQAVYLELNPDGSLSVIPREGEEAAAARENLRKALISDSLFLDLFTHLETSATLPVWNAELKKYQQKDVPGLGAVLAIALSESSKKMSGRSLFLKDIKGKVARLDITSSTEKEKLEQLISRLKIFGKAKGEGGKPRANLYQISNSPSNNKPADIVFSFTEKQNRYSKSNNDAEIENWLALNKALEVLKEESFSERVRQELVHHGRNFDTTKMAKLLEDPEFASVRSQYQEPLVAKNVHELIEKFLDKALAPSNSDSTIITSTPVGASIPIQRSTPQQPRLAIILKTDVAPQQSMVAQIAGAPVEYVENPKDLETAIKKHFRGVPLGLILGAHGAAGRMPGLYSPAQKENKTLFDRTQGMVANITSLGCEVGQAVDEDSPHCLKEWALGWNVSAVGFDKYVWSGPNGITFKAESPHMIKVSPNPAGIRKSILHTPWPNELD